MQTRKIKNLKNVHIINIELLLYIMFIGEAQADAPTLKSNTKRYDCPDCSEVLYLTPTETLKHKKTHL